jgi:hypothetical protein
MCINDLKLNIGLTETFLGTRQQEMICPSLERGK